MDELTLDNKKYLSSKRAAQVTGYAKDYVGQLCREGHVEARLVGRNWYVLETSILDHRFGKEDKAPKEAPPTEQELESTWKTPTYSSESIQSIPELEPKPRAVVPDVHPTPVAPVEENTQVLADMQAAWKEWFENQPKELPDASEMLLSDHVDTPVESATEAETPSPEVESHEIEPEIAVPIHVERNIPADVPTQRYSAPQQPPVQDRYQEILKESRPVEPRMVPQQQRRVRRRTSSPAILRAVFIGLAVIAVATTLIGAGLFDRFIDVGGRSFITDFLSGRSDIKK